jgi:hypothetical protein
MPPSQGTWSVWAYITAMLTMRPPYGHLSAGLMRAKESQFRNRITDMRDITVQVQRPDLTGVQISKWLHPSTSLFAVNDSECDAAEGQESFARNIDCRRTKAKAEASRVISVEPIQAWNSHATFISANACQTTPAQKNTRCLTTASGRRTCSRLSACLIVQMVPTCLSPRSRRCSRPTSHQPDGCRKRSDHAPQPRSNAG